jgi:hypothetical protein
MLWRPCRCPKRLLLSTWKEYPRYTDIILDMFVQISSYTHHLCTALSLSNGYVYPFGSISISDWNFLMRLWLSKKCNHTMEFFSCCETTCTVNICNCKLVHYLYYATIKYPFKMKICLYVSRKRIKYL